MARRIEAHTLAGPEGDLEALLEEPEDGDPRLCAVVCHPHPIFGGTMHNKVVYRLARGLRRAGIVVLRFNFRGVGVSDGAFDEGIGEKDDFRAGIDFMARRYPGVPIWAAGMSFGSWVAMTAGADDNRVTTLVGIAVPISLYDFSAVRVSTKPKFFIHGEHDEICALRAVREFYDHASEPKDLVVIDAANHLFDGQVTEVAEAIEDLLR